MSLNLWPLRKITHENEAKAEKYNLKKQKQTIMEKDQWRFLSSLCGSFLFFYLSYLSYMNTPVPFQLSQFFKLHFLFARKTKQKTPFAWVPGCRRHWINTVNEWPWQEAPEEQSEGLTVWRVEAAALQSRSLGFCRQLGVLSTNTGFLRKSTEVLSASLVSMGLYFTGTFCH